MRCSDLSIFYLTVLLVSKTLVAVHLSNLHPITDFLGLNTGLFGRKLGNNLQ